MYGFETMNCMGALGSMGMGSMGMGGALGWSMWLFWILLFGLLIWGVYRLTTRAPSRSTRDTPLDVLQRRYAKGDLSTEEYEERKRVLGH